MVEALTSTSQASHSLLRLHARTHATGAATLARPHLYCSVMGAESSGSREGTYNRTTLVLSRLQADILTENPPLTVATTTPVVSRKDDGGLVLPGQSTSLSTVAQPGDDEGGPVQRRSFGPSARKHAAGRRPTRGHHRQSADLKRGVREVAHLRVTPLTGG
jgi:hypothetical protein